MQLVDTFINARIAYATSRNIQPQFAPFELWDVSSRIEKRLYLVHSEQELRAHLEQMINRCSRIRVTIIHGHNGTIRSWIVSPQNNTFITE